MIPLLRKEQPVVSENVFVLLVVLLLSIPICFSLGWWMARIDLKSVLRDAKTVPASLYRALSALADRNANQAAAHLRETLDGQLGAAPPMELVLAVGKLQRAVGENDRAIRLHRQLLETAELAEEERERLLFELGRDYQNAGLIDRAETQFKQLLSGHMANRARQVLLQIYQQDRDWEAAIRTAQDMVEEGRGYQFEISQFHCELAWIEFVKNRLGEAKRYALQALEINKKSTRANMILGKIAQKEGRLADALEAYMAIERQNPSYLSMVGEQIYEVCEAQGRAEEGLDILTAYQRTFSELDLVGLIYEKTLALRGESAAMGLTVELVRRRPDLQGIDRLLSMHFAQLNPEWKADVDMMRAVIGRHIRQSHVYRCRRCHFKSQSFFWYCPACNEWETFTPNRTEH